jgi:putative DNA primase/helicase
MACNELPDLNDFSGGLERRLIIVPFEASFHGSAMDPDLDAVLESELPGILNRVIESYQRLIAQNGFTKSQIVLDTVNQYKTLQNSVASWFTENVEIDSDLAEPDVAYTDNRKVSPRGWYETSTKIYQAYAEFCGNLRAKPVSPTKFGIEIRRLTGISSSVKKIEGRVIRVYEGIKFFDSAAADFS